MYEYRCKLRRVVDGDTVDIDIDLGFDIWLTNQRVRLYGVDTPESRTRDKEEKKYGLAAKAYVERFLDDEWLTLKTAKFNAVGKFGRILGSLYRTSSFADQSLNEYLIEKHHAVPYYGQSKEEIKEQHLKNRELVQL